MKIFHSLPSLIESVSFATQCNMTRHCWQCGSECGGYSWFCGGQLTPNHTRMGFWTPVGWVSVAVHTTEPRLPYLIINAKLKRGRMTHIDIGKLGHHWLKWWHWNIFGNIAHSLWIEHLGRNFEVKSRFPIKKTNLKQSFAKCRPFCFSHNVLLTTH